MSATIREEQILKLRRKLRGHPALYGEAGEAKELQAERILHKTTGRLQRLSNERYEDRKHAAGQRMLRTWA